MCGSCSSNIFDNVDDDKVLSVCYDFAQVLYNNCLRDKFYNEDVGECEVIGETYKHENEFVEGTGMQYLNIAANIRGKVSKVQVTEAGDKDDCFNSVESSRSVTWLLVAVGSLLGMLGM
jgi:hypothetical protein